MLLRYGRREIELFGGEKGITTNNRMELTAPIRALESLPRPSVVRIFTDSTYVQTGITAWLPRWKRNGWLTAAKQPVKNTDLWLRLEQAAARHKVQWLWIKGHAGHPGNERADRLATRGLAEVAGVQPIRLPRPRAAPERRRGVNHLADHRGRQNAHPRLF